MWRARERNIRGKYCPIIETSSGKISAGEEVIRDVGRAGKETYVNRSPSIISYRAVSIATVFLSEHFSTCRTRANCCSPFFILIIPGNQSIPIEQVVG